MCYSANQSYIDYSTSQILQMIGRAGRPQFDRTANAVIMTKMNEKVRLVLIFFQQSILENLNLIKNSNTPF
jgi:ATP-dependent DNA helicase HFM1/MER3